MKKCCSKKCCWGKCLVTTLLVIGGLNWALVGIGIFTGGNLNVVNLIFGGVPWLEAVIYFLVGLSALSLMTGGCRCKKCKGGKCKEKKCTDGTCDKGLCCVDGKCEKCKVPEEIKEDRV